MAGWRKGGDGGGRKRPGDAGRGEPARRPLRPEHEGQSKPPVKPVKSSWRKQKAAQAPAASTSSSGSRHYRRTGGFFGFLFGRRLKLWTLACAFAVLLAGIAWLLLSVPSPVPVVAVAVSAYRDPRIPHNLTALTDVERLSADTLDFRKVELAIDKTVRDSFAAAFAKKLSDANPGGSAFSRTKSVIVYVSAHGVVNGDRKACLLLTDSDPLDESTWYPVSEILTAIKNEPNFQNATKLLALDCCRIRSDWRLGIVDNQFTKVLRDEVEKAGVPDLAVLTSASPGQLAWSSPELGGGTVFGHFFALGLHGAAAKHPPGRRAGLSSLLPKETLSVGELSKYVQEHVSRWVAATRRAEQKPQLLTIESQTESLKKSDLAWISQRGPPDGPLTGAGRRSHDAERAKIRSHLQQFWSEHQRRQDAPAWRLYPMPWAEFELRLVRYEELYLDAVTDRDALDAAKSEVEKALRLLDDRLPSIVFPSSAPLAKNFPGVPADDGPGTIEACFETMTDQHIYDSDRQRFAGQIAHARQARNDTENLAAPFDPRVLYWLRPLLDSIDEDRRKAEDLLFVGNPQSLAEAEKLWVSLLGSAGTAGSLEQAQARSRAVADALLRRDEIWARLWWFARWLYGSPGRKSEPSANLAEQLDQLIDAAQALSRDLELIHKGESPPLAETMAQAAAADEQLAAAFNQHRHDTRKSREDAGELATSGALAALYRLLNLPLVTGDDRQQLREQYDRLLGKVDESKADLLKKGGGASPETEDAADPPFGAANVVERLLGINETEDDRQVSANERWSRFLGAEAAIRKSLANTFESIRAAAVPSEREIDVDRRPLVPEKAGDKQWLTVDLARREGLSAADLAGRRRAWFTPRLEALASLNGRTWESPSRRLMRFDLANLAYWHCDRALDDFWGPVPGAADKVPFFSRSARAFLGALAADETVKRDADFADRRKHLEAKLEIREKAVRLRATVAEKNIVFEANVDELRQTAAVSTPSGAPAGIAAVFVAELGGRELDRSLWCQDRDHRDSWRQAVALPADPSRQPAEFTINKEVTGDARAGRQLACGALFRGHVSSDADPAASFVARLRVLRAIEPPVVRAAPPEILVKGSRHSVTEILFIVDASGSMNEDVRGKQGVAVLDRKWTIARGAMQTILSELLARQPNWLANNEEWQAGLMVYGHRAAWPKRFSRVLYNEAATSEDRQAWAAQGIVPQADVELLVATARFGDDLAKQIVTALDRAKPWGQTPLYYSLREAIKELEKNAKPAIDQPYRRIILVTDGVNDNPRPPSGGADTGPEAVKAALEAFKARFRAPIHVDVVYFGVVEQRDRKDLDSLSRFVQEASELAGKVPGEDSDHMHRAESPDSLVNSVRTAVERNRLRYRVVHTDTTAAEADLLPANSTWTAPAGAALPERYKVQIDGSPEASLEVRVEGGESLRLVFRKDKLEFEQQPDEKGLLKRMAVGSGQGRLNVYQFAPNAGSDDVLFKFGVQYVDKSRFTPRPADVWAEITPIHLDADGTLHEDEDEPAVFFGRSFLPGQRMPVLQFKFPKWPAQANAARVKLWLQFPDERGRSPVARFWLKYADLARAGAAKDKDVALAGFPVLLHATESALGNGGVRITIAEQQVDDGRPRDWCRVELSARASSVRPDAVTHRYFLGERRAEHVFEFVEGTKPDVAELEVLATPAATLKNNAVQVPAEEADVWLLPVKPGGGN
jgi:Mg-chelatase subunit ChlD